jgi:hypothetical protein
MAARIGTLECTELTAEVFLLLRLQDSIRKSIRFYTENAVIPRTISVNMVTGANISIRGKRVITGFINQEQPLNHSSVTWSCRSLI